MSEINLRESNYSNTGIVFQKEDKLLRVADLRQSENNLIIWFDNQTNPDLLNCQKGDVMINGKIYKRKDIIDDVFIQILTIAPTTYFALEEPQASNGMLLKVALKSYLNSNYVQNPNTIYPIGLNPLLYAKVSLFDDEVLNIISQNEKFKTYFRNDIYYFFKIVKKLINESPERAKKFLTIMKVNLKDIPKVKEMFENNITDEEISDICFLGNDEENMQYGFSNSNNIILILLRNEKHFDYILSNNSVMKMFYKLIVQKAKECLETLEVIMGKQEQVERLLSTCPYFFSVLSDKYRQDPKFLNIALKSSKFDQSNPTINNIRNREIDSVNLISYALPNSLNKENIELSVNKGYIDFKNMSEETKKEVLTKDYILNYLNLYMLSFDDFEFFPEEFKSDYEVISKLMEKSPHLFSKLDRRYREDPTILKIAVTNFKTEYGINPITYALPNAISRKNKNIAIEKGNIQFTMLEEESKNILFDKNFILRYIEKHEIYQYQYEAFPDSLKRNHDVSLNLMKRSPTIYCKLEEEFRKNPALLTTALRSYNKCFEDKDNYWKKKNPILAAFPEALDYTNIVLGGRVYTTEKMSSFEQSRESLVQKIAQNPILVRYTRNYNNNGMLLEAIFANHKVYSYLPEEKRQELAVYVAEMVSDPNLKSLFRDIRKARK